MVMSRCPSVLYIGKMTSRAAMMTEITAVMTENDSCEATVLMIQDHELVMFQYYILMVIG